MTTLHTPAASVIIPCHNATEFLAETLGSILSQSWQDFEILIVDDGSTDDPGPIVASFNEDRIHLIYAPASGGPSRPRNLAAAQARGRYLFFCDADDTMLPDKMKKQVDVLDKYPDFGLVFTNFQVVGPQNQLLSPSFLEKYDTLWRIIAESSLQGGGIDRDLMFSGLLRANFIGTSGVAMHRKVFEDLGGFDEDLRSSEDFDFWVRIARKYTCAYLDIVGHAYRVHPESIMQKKSIALHLAGDKVLKRLLDYAPGPMDRRSILRKLSKKQCCLGYFHERHGDLDSARFHYLESFRFRPNFSATWGLLKVHTIYRLGVSIMKIRSGKSVYRKRGRPQY